MERFVVDSLLAGLAPRIAAVWKWTCDNLGFLIFLAVHEDCSLAPAMGETSRLTQFGTHSLVTVECYGKGYHF